ncbi:MAG: hypothetical protein Crog4KO_06770 [Crocinitomicaceae bacterium]
MKIGYILLGAGVVGLGAYAAYQYFGKPKMTFDTSDEEPEPEVPKPTPSRSFTQASTFPLKTGSRGPLVIALQNALNQKHGATLNPDGVLGPITQAAIIAAGFPSILFEDQYRKLLGGKKNEPSKPSTSSGSPKPKKRFDPLKMADIFHFAIREHKFTKVRELLSMMKSTKDYSDVNRYFKARDMYDGTKRTLVNGLLHKFKSDWGKKTISGHLFRMGLKFNGNKWSLKGISGFDGRIKTIKKTTVWNDSQQTLKVPSGTILGDWIGTSSNVVKFRTLDGKLLYADASAIRYA